MLVIVGLVGLRICPWLFLPDFGFMEDGVVLNVPGLVIFFSVAEDFEVLIPPLDMFTGDLTRSFLLSHETRGLMNCLYFIICLLKSHGLCTDELVLLQKSSKNHIQNI